MLVQDINGDVKPEIWIDANLSAIVTNTFTIYHNRLSPGPFKTSSLTQYKPLSNFNNGLTRGKFIDFDNDGRPDFFNDQATNFFSISRGNPQSFAIPFSTSVTPSKALVGQNVVINGYNFNTDIAKNEVWFGGVKAIVNSVTENTINVKVPYGSSYQHISVLNNTTGATKYTKESFVTLFEAQVKDFNPGVSFPTGNMPASVALADIDSDGKLELIVAEAGSSKVSIYRNTSLTGSLNASSFSNKVDFPTGPNPAFVVVKDINGDGKPDILTANFGSNSISILRNTSSPGAITSATFAGKVDFVTGAKPSSLSIADIDNDGKPDIAVANSGSNTISVFKNIGSKGNPFAIVFAKTDFVVGPNPTSVILSDIDDDNKPDIVTTLFGVNKIAILPNVTEWTKINDLSFGNKTEFVTGLAPQYLTVGDLSGDGKPDVIVANKSSKTISIFRNTSVKGSINSVSLATKFDLISSTGVVALALGDINGDGSPDIISANKGLNTISIFGNESNQNTFDATSFTRLDQPTGAGPQGIT
ncbi:MAG: hypothetical protein EOP51_26430, partial [Sphingobacteriales bacterium]